jgi:Putative Actinobacterial Holin-X, holin superfamily III/Protein of unknown function (DUF3618)
MFRRRSGSSGPSLVQLVKSLVADALRLVQGEVELVQARFGQTLRRGGIAVAILLGAAATALLGLTGLGVAAGLAIAIVLPGWAAALIVGGGLVAGGAAGALLGLVQLRLALRARSSGPPDVEAELQETRYRLEAELEALTAKLDPRHRARKVEEPASGGNGRVAEHARR